MIFRLILVLTLFLANYSSSFSQANKSTVTKTKSTKTSSKSKKKKSKSTKKKSKSTKKKSKSVKKKRRSAKTKSKSNKIKNKPIDIVAKKTPPKIEHKIVKIPIYTNQKTNLYALSDFFKKAEINIAKNHKMYEVTKDRNGDIKDWNNIPAGTKIKFYMFSEYIDPEKFLRYNQMLAALMAQKARELNRRNSIMVRLRLGMLRTESLDKLINHIKVDYARIPKNDKTYIYTKGKKQNKHIKDWNEIPEDEEVNLYIYKKYVDYKRLREYKRRYANKGNRYKNSVFFVTSSGTLNESYTAHDIYLDQSQDSPLTLGVSTFRRFDPELKHLMYSGSFYFSLIDRASYENIDTDIPPEIGITSYAEYINKGWPASLYTGFDYEKLSSYDISKVPTEGKLGIVSNQLLYVTLGVSKLFAIKNKRVLTKFSVSKSVWSATSGTIPFKGMKFILFAALPITQRLSASIFLKRHSFSGESELLIQRVGIGGAFSF